MVQPARHMAAAGFMFEVKQRSQMMDDMYNIWIIYKSQRQCFLLLEFRGLKLQKDSEDAFKSGADSEGGFPSDFVQLPGKII